MTPFDSPIRPAEGWRLGFGARRDSSVSIHPVVGRHPDPAQATWADESSSEALFLWFCTRDVQLQDRRYA